MRYNSWVLVHTKTGAPATLFETITDFRGNQSILKGGRPPQHPNSSGRVWTGGGEFFPSVFDLCWIQDAE